MCNIVILCVHLILFLTLTMLLYFAIHVVLMQTSTTHPQKAIPLRHLVVVARKGQITIPAPIREELGVKEGDTIAIELQGDEAKITPISSTLAAGYQSLPALPSSLNRK